MNIVLQNKNNLKFIETTAGRWTANGEQAHVFASGLDALYFCFHHHLLNMQILAKFRDPHLDFSFPITDAYGPAN